MSEVNTNKEVQEDEISLLDLFAVLIRYRKLVVWGTVLVALITGLYFFVLPKFQKNNTSHHCKVTYTVDVNAFPVAVINRIAETKDLTTIERAVAITSELPLLAQQIKQYDVFAVSGMSSIEYNNYVQSLFGSGTISVEGSKGQTNYTICFKVAQNKIEETTKLAKGIVAQVEKELNSYYSPLIKAVAINAASLGFEPEVKEFTDEFDSFLELREEPFVTTIGQGRAKKSIIIVFAAFFIFVFIAFCLNAVANIKADPASNKTISDAWKAGKFKKQ